MNPATAQAVLAEIGNEGLWRTNPVHCVDELVRQWRSTDVGSLAAPSRLRSLLTALAEHGVRFPAAAIARWVSDGLLSDADANTIGDGEVAPDVLGLAVDGSGYVCPLHPNPTSEEWRIDPELPFTVEQLQDGLIELLRASHIPDGAVPERFAFVFENPLRRRIRGDSMTVAAILSVLQQMATPTPLLRAAIALVELRPGGQLGAVSDIPTKLGAALRECGRLSLVIVPPGVTIEPEQAENVWEVSSVVELAHRLNDAGLLTPLFDIRGPLTGPEAVRVRERFRQLLIDQHRYREAADLGDRVRQCGLATSIDPGLRIELARYHAEACRYHGRFGDATTISHEAHDSIAALGELGCDDEEADAAAEYGASLFSGHRFAEIPRLLKRWSSIAIQEPRRFRPLTRVKIWNTLGRAFSILNRPGWYDLFTRSLEIHRGLNDHENLNRTAYYCIHAQLHRGDTGAARQVISATRFLESASTTVWAAFVEATLARLENRMWIDPILDERIQTTQPPYPAWLYLQATARQLSQSPDEAERRFASAIRLLRDQAGGVAENICNLFAELLELAAAARFETLARWQTARSSIQTFLANTDRHLHSYYAVRVGTLPSTPTLPAAEELLKLVPYF